MNEVLERLSAAVQLKGDDVAVRAHSEYQPQAGSGAKVHPPTYLAGPDGRYHLEQRWGPDGMAIDVVVLDSIQSQANRAERALRDGAARLGLPQIVMRAEFPERLIVVSSLDAPHRSRDAYFIDSLAGDTPFDRTEVGRSLSAATADDATAYLRYAPYDLIYGVWDSHRGKRMPTKFPRIVTSEMLGWHVLRGKKAATKGDPLNLPGEDRVPLQEWRPELETKNKKNADEKMSELGHGMIPVPPDPAAGGVAVKRITRTGVISLTALAPLRFPTGNGGADVAGRVALAALALLADRLAFARAGINLRSGSDLVLGSDRLEWVQRGGKAEPLELGVDAAEGVLDEARQRLGESGVTWDPEPYVLTASPRLRAIIERTFSVAQLDGVG